MHAEAFQFVATAARTHAAVGPVYEIGSRNINGSVRPLFVGERYLGADVHPGPDVDVVADAAGYDPRARLDYFTPATVVCCEVLEHAANAEAIIAKACEVLAPGGLLIVTCATDGRAPHSAIDGGGLRAGEFYRNLPATELVEWTRAHGVRALTAESWERGDLYFVGRKAVA
jgi:SAM-dependent methyltransferase